jgi:hypothetical protein
MRSATLLHTILLLRRGQLSTPRDRVAAKGNSTAAGSSKTATTRINHRKTTSSAAPSSVSQIPHLAKIGLDLPPLAHYGGLLDLQVGEDLRFDRELVGKAVAFGLPSVGVHGAEVRRWHRSQGGPRLKPGACDKPSTTTVELRAPRDAVLLPASSAAANAPWKFRLMRASTGSPCQASGVIRRQQWRDAVFSPKKSSPSFPPHA